jgi:hypothetical protein
MSNRKAWFSATCQFVFGPSVFSPNGISQTAINKGVATKPVCLANESNESEPSRCRVERSKRAAPLINLQLSPPQRFRALLPAALRAVSQTNTIRNNFLSCLLVTSKALSP